MTYLQTITTSLKIIAGVSLAVIATSAVLMVAWQMLPDRVKGRIFK